MWLQNWQKLIWQKIGWLPALTFSNASTRAGLCFLFNHWKFPKRVRCKLNQWISRQGKNSHQNELLETCGFDYIDAQNNCWGWQLLNSLIVHFGSDSFPKITWTHSFSKQAQLNKSLKPSYQFKDNIQNMLVNFQG